MKNCLPILLMAFWPVFLSAQVVVSGESVKRNKRDVEVRFDLESTPKSLKSRYKIEITPFLYSGTDTAYLPPVEVYGKIRYRRERQEAALSGNPRWSLSSHQVMEGTPYRYFASFPYEGWMRQASLGYTRQVVGCGCDCYDGSTVVAENLPVYTAPIPHISESIVEPARYEVADAHRRWAFEGDEIKVFFPVSKTDLLLTEYGNQAALDRIIAGIRQIGDLDSLRLNGVEITGFASPEGREGFNVTLGKGRVESLRNYIRSRVPELSDDDFELINGEENWSGLRRLVAASDMPFRQEVLDIIDGETGDARKESLRRLEGGRPYAYMLRHFYPELRNASYIAVYFDVLRDFGADAINAANTAIRSGDYAYALSLLEPYREDSRTWNSIGVCCMMLEREDEAIEWFEKALTTDQASEARRNLEQLK